MALLAMAAVMFVALVVIPLGLLWLDALMAG